MFANQPPRLVCIRTLTGPGLPFPSTPPQGRWGDEFNTLKTVVRRWPLVVRQRPSTGGHRLSLRELEALPCAFLPVLLALFGAGITSYHALGLELLAQFRIEQHESAGDAQAHHISLYSDS